MRCRWGIDQYRFLSVSVYDTDFPVKIRSDAREGGARVERDIGGAGESVEWLLTRGGAGVWWRWEIRV